jgi:hypothetical protein
MAKLTRAQAKSHAAAVERLQQDHLTEDDKEFVYRNWNEGANHVNGAAGAFFTPFDMAFDFAIDAGGGASNRPVFRHWHAVVCSLATQPVQPPQTTDYLCRA